MLPFQKIPILLPGNPEEEQGDKEVMARIQPAEIESFNDGYNFGCLIKFKSGEIIMTRLTADEVEALLAKYWRTFNDQVTRATNGPTIVPIN